MSLYRYFGDDYGDRAVPVQRISLATRRAVNDATWRRDNALKAPNVVAAHIHEAKQLQQTDRVYRYYLRQQTTVGDVAWRYPQDLA